MSQQINLFNPVFLRQKRQFSALAMAQALGLVTLGALAMYAYEVRQNRVLADVLAQTEKQLDARREQMTRFGKEFSAQGASRALGAELSAAETRLAARRGLLEEVKTGMCGLTSPRSTAKRRSPAGGWRSCGPRRGRRPRPPARRRRRTSRSATSSSRSRCRPRVSCE